MNRTLRTALAATSVVLAGIALTACSSGASDSVVGVWGTPDVRGEVSLEFMEDGSLAGSDGCNRVMGQWEEDGGAVTFGPLATTMMYCEDVDVWLVDPASAEVKGDTLIVKDSTGAELGTLERSE